MSFEASSAEPSRRRNIGMKVALIGAGVAAGAIVATAIGANAATSNSSAPSTTAPSAGAGYGNAPGGSGPGGRPGPAGADPVRNDEKSVTSAQAATLKAAALKAVPGGTVIRVETDAGDAVYEVHMTKSDSTLVTVKFDKNLKVTRVESGMGLGDPAPPRQR